jgi:cytochrome c oxidase subunit 2
MIGKLARLVLVVGGLTIFGSAAAQMYPPDSESGVPGEELYRACGFCHGAQGQGRQRLDAPAIAGLEAWYTERQIRNFIDGVRGMHPEDLPGRQMALITGMFRNNDATIANVSAFIETLEPGGPLESRPNGELFPLERPFTWDSQYAELDMPAPGDAAAGQQTFQVTCALCHGANGLGNAALGGNKLVDLPDWYIARQLKYFRDGIRGANSSDTFGMQMAAMANLLRDDQQIADVIAYIETL